MSETTAKEFYELAKARRDAMLHTTDEYLETGNWADASAAQITASTTYISELEADNVQLKAERDALAKALKPFAAAYDLFFVGSDRGDKSLYWFENTSRHGKQHPNFTLFVEDFRRAAATYPDESEGVNDGHV